MIGCFKFILKTIIVILAIVGLKSIVGDKFFEEKINPFKQLTQTEKIQKARQIAQFDDISKSYDIDKTANFLGYKMILAEHKKTGQKLAFIDPGAVPMLSKKDFKENKAKGKIEKLNEKLQYQYIRLDNFKITNQGEFKAMEQSIPYVRFEADVVNMPLDGVSGFVGVAKNQSGKDVIVASVNEPDKYSQRISEDFFKKFK